MPTQFTVTNSPVTTSGTLTANWNSQTQNTFLAAPNGAAGVPTFRAIVAADVPTLNQNTSGNAATATNASNTSSISNAVGTTYTWTATQYFTGNGDTASSAGIGAQAYSTGGNGAIMAFHRAGVYAINMGLDSDNVFRIGGWSAGANRLQMDMSGNLTMAGTLGGTGLAGGASTGSGASGTWGINITGSAGIATALNSSNYIDRTGSSGNLNTDFSNTPAGTQRYQGDDANLTNSPGNTWWIYENKRHSNSSNVWGTQVAWGWEDNANRLATRNVQNGSFGAWVYYLNSSNFTTYAPSLTGSGASGTWGINITGNAATATTATNQSGGTVNATTAVVTPNAAGVSTGFTVVNGDITAYRTGGTTGAIYLSSSGGNYLFWDGSTYYLGGNVALSSGNYNSYAPTLTGGGASGSWGISVTGTSANVTGTVAVANGGTGATAAAGARTNLGATTLGANVFTVPNVAAIAFPRFNADNTVSTLDAASFRTAIGAGTGSGTVTSVATSGTVSGLTLTGGTITTTGTITLGGTLAVTPSNFAFQNANTFLAAPNGSGGVPTFRTVVVADIPTLNQNTTGSSGSCTGNAATATTATTATNVSGGTISNARLNPRTLTNTTASTVTPDIAVYDQYNFTALSSALTVNAPIGTPVDGNKLILRLLDNGTARALTWNTTYVAMGFTLPTTTVANKMTYVGCIYNSTNARWDVIAVATQA
jgi:hypothetical protein